MEFDGDNSFPDCRQCGDCCHIAVIAMTRDELARIHQYIEFHCIKPIDRGYELCPLRAEDGTCMVWEARSQTCRLHHCEVPRTQILEANPSIEIPLDLEMVSLYDEFILGNEIGAGIVKFDS